jgi:hypothetical protein
MSVVAKLSVRGGPDPESGRIATRKENKLGVKCEDLGKCMLERDENGSSRKRIVTE